MEADILFSLQEIFLLQELQGLALLNSVLNMIQLLDMQSILLQTASATEQQNLALKSSIRKVILNGVLRDFINLQRMGFRVM